MTFPLCGLDPATLARLSGVGLTARRPSALPSPGRRPSRRHGSSPEFADYRDYAPGDDLRRVDWNAYARLDRLYLRLYRAEHAGSVALYLDRSASMTFGGKSATAGRIAAILAYTALHSHDRISVAALGGPALPPQSGHQAIPRVFRFISEQMTAPAGDSTGPISAGGPGTALLISDLLTDDDWRTNLLYLRSAGCEVGIIQILAPEEITPDLRGEFQLRDVESGETVDVSGSANLDRLYRQALDSYLAGIRDFCRRREMNYALIPSDTNDAGILRHLQSAGIVT